LVVETAFAGPEFRRGREFRPPPLLVLVLFLLFILFRPLKDRCFDDEFPLKP